eukprot:TRINITY_DN107456_c0_g1_i1.p1 TRINITY_DN107456_c0_g1~~TRINITY_DN107456_c0_g1_i1.p1  ORF type:complete len:569 (+),score=102.62 TRINITY_DN107456_c0_g1_i1:37-1743(+)
MALRLLGRLGPWRIRARAPVHCRSFLAAAATSETHGGDDIHNVDRFVCDFSVTTNALGPVPSALEATKRLLEDVTLSTVSGSLSSKFADRKGLQTQVATAPAVEHYPKRSDDELEEITAAFLRGEELMEETKQKLIFGNGASELIDLLARAAPQGGFYLNPHTEVQYREYQRACKNVGREQVEQVKDASIVCLVNPNNPTGDFLERAQMEAWISDNAPPGSWVLVDESMLFWAGPDWQKRGVSASFVKSMAKRHIQIFLVQSWTKIFACTGLRIGTVLCPTTEKKKHLQSMQVPWSVTTFARTYLKAALQDREYLERTWLATPKWREHMVSRLQRLHPSWKFLGQPWLSYVWIDTGSPEIAENVYRTALQCGCPIRNCALGYDKPSVVRIAVRRPYDFSVLYQALLQRECDSKSNVRAPFGTSADVNPSVVEGVRLVHIDDLKPHEEVLTDRASKLQEYVRDLPVKILPAIIVDSQYQVVIDGHHRLELFRAAGMTIVPAVSVNYEHEDILVNPTGVRPDITKESVIGCAVKGTTLAPKSTQHMVRSRGGALLPIIVLAPQIAELWHA